MTSLVSDVETGRDRAFGSAAIQFEPISYESVTSSNSDLPPVTYQPTSLHIRVLLTQLGAHVPSVLLSQLNTSVAVVENWCTCTYFAV